MNVQLSKTDLIGMSGSAGDVQAAATAARKIVDEAPAPRLTGWQTNDAIAEITAAIADRRQV